METLTDKIILDIKKNRRKYHVVLHNGKTYDYCTMDKDREQCIKDLFQLFHDQPTMTIFENGEIVFEIKKKLTVMKILNRETKDIYETLEEAMEATGKTRNMVISHIRNHPRSWSKLKRIICEEKSLS